MKCRRVLGCSNCSVWCSEEQKVSYVAIQVRLLQAIIAIQSTQTQQPNIIHSFKYYFPMTFRTFRSTIIRQSRPRPLLYFTFPFLFLPLVLQPAVGFGLSNNTSPFFPIYNQLSPSSHSHHLKISFHFFSPSFPGSSSSSHPFQFLSEDLSGHPILLHSLQVTQPTYPLPLYPFYYIFSFTQLFQYFPIYVLVFSA